MTKVLLGVACLGLLLAIAVHVTASSDGTGRWTLVGGACTWTTGDTGADECARPAGRFKLNAQGCSWAANDTGADQCTPKTGRYVLGAKGCMWQPSEIGDNQCTPTN